jgi:hypothetical protein
VVADRAAAPAPPALRQKGVAAEKKAAAAKAEAANAPAALASRRAARAEAADQNRADGAGQAEGVLGGGPAPAASRPLVPEVHADPACVGEARRVLWRDAGGRLLRRERAGVLGGVAYRAEETFDLGGALAEGRIEAGGRVASADGAGVAAGRLAGVVEGLRLAATATQAEAEPPRCGP